MTAKHRLFENFEIAQMTKSSLLLRHVKDGHGAYISRHAFTRLDEAKDIREVQVEIGGKPSTRIEVLVWQR